MYKTLNSKNAIATTTLEVTHFLPSLSYTHFASFIGRLYHPPQLIHMSPHKNENFTRQSTIYITRNFECKTFSLTKTLYVLKFHAIDLPQFSIAAIMKINGWRS